MSLRIEELAGVKLADPFYYPDLLGEDYARVQCELIAEDHAFTFKTCWQKFNPTCILPYGPKSFVYR